MRKIKFKTEYVPLSDDAINRHKNFDQLMAAYATAPKPNWFKQFIQKKWTMFGGGLFTGAIITSALWYSMNVQEVQTTAVDAVDYVSEIKAKELSQSNPTDEAYAPSQGKEVTGILHEAERKAADAEKKDFNNAAIQNQSDAAQATAERTTNNAKEKTVLASATPTKRNAPDKNASLKMEEKTFAVKAPAESANDAVIEKEEIKVTSAVTAAKDAMVMSDGLKDALQNDRMDTAIAESHTVTIGPVMNETVVNVEESFSPSSLTETELQEDKLNPEVIAGAALLSAPAISSGVPSADEKKVEGKNKPEGNTVNNSVTFSLLKLNPFRRDSSNKTADDAGHSGWLNFGKDSSDKQHAARHLTTDSTFSSGNNSGGLSDDSLYIQRYAQVSFITPMSSNGIDGYKYKHYISLNILQGYNGALEGAEFGGLINGLKGYATGAQFAGLGNHIGGNLKGAQFGGLGNYAGGDIKGAQFGGLANIGASVSGAQFGGITNISRSYVTGFQAAGIANLAADSLNGAQVAGIVNIESSSGKSTSWQIAGIGNIALGKNSGGQIGGIFNIANNLKGGQIGLINYGKKISGFQIGLINVSDSIDGPAIGLISVSADGIFDVNAWSSDFLTFNGGIRVGTRNIYNIYAYGISPFNADLPFGFGAGIGGHIPVKKFFVDIDGMAWSMHRSYISFERINLVNTFRVMGGYTFSKYFSVFAGPTLNVSIQDNHYEPFLPNYFYESINQDNTIRIAPGFVAGIRLF